MRLQHHTALTKPPTRPQAWTCEFPDPPGSAQLLNAFHVSHFLRPAFESGVLYFANEVGKADAVISGLGAPWIKLGLGGLRSGPSVAFLSFLGLQALQVAECSLSYTHRTSGMCLAHSSRYCRVPCTKTARHPSPSSTSSSEILRGVLHGELALPRSSAVGGGGGLEEACFRDVRVLPHLGSGKLPPACRLNEARERDDLSAS